MKLHLRIATQNALLVLSLFLPLAVGSAWLSFDVLRRELAWGFNQEIEALLVASAELVDREAVERLAAGEEADLEVLRTPLRRLRQWGQLHRLTIFDPRGAHLFTFGGPPGAAREAMPELASRAPRPTIAPLPRSAEEGTLLSAVAPIEAAGGGHLGWLRIETNVEELFVEVDRYRRKVTVQAGATVLLGLLLVALLTAIVAPRIRELIGAAEEIRAGRFGHQLDTGGVRELNDLATTVNTMVSVLGETIDKGRRSVADREQFRRPEEIAATWARQRQEPAALEIGDYEVSSRRGEETPHGTFLDLVGTDGPPAGFLALAGEIGDGEPLDRAAAASAALFFFRQHAAVLPPRELVERLHRTFGARWTKLLAWTGGESEIELLSVSADGTLEAFPVTRERLSGRGLLLVQTYDPLVDRMIDSLARWTAPLEGSRLLAHLERLLPTMRREAKIYLSRRSER